MICEILQIANIKNQQIEKNENNKLKIKQIDLKK